MLGGKPNNAFFFFYFDGRHLRFLDPHHPQPTVNMAGAWSTASYFTERETRLAYRDLDPCVSLVFLVKYEEDFAQFMKGLDAPEFKKIFTIKRSRVQTFCPDDFIAIDDELDLLEADL